MIEVIIILGGALIIGLWAFKWAFQLLGVVIGWIYLLFFPEQQQEPRQGPQGHTLDEILAYEPPINLN
jgi:hypothetical protein|tara:strand:+ start:223 stop:426 length:204 start_codon:yes stop_codon:yes gene_type:complete